MTHNQFNNIESDAVILCGGLGTRLKAIIPDKQKCVADVGGRPFLDILIDALVSFGFVRIILAVGYKGEQVVEYFSQRKDCLIKFSIEEEPLGTGGALKNARNFIGSEHFLAMNGDTFFPVHLINFYNFHLDNDALFSIAASRVKDVSNSGSVEIGDNKRIINFHEKNKKIGEGLVSGGVYFMRKNIFEYMPDEDNFSLEYDLFPKILDKNCFGYVVDKEFIDIGLPENYLKAAEMISWLSS